MEKMGSLTFQKIAHLITAVDCQPMFDGGILINVLGQLKVRVGQVATLLAAPCNDFLPWYKSMSPWGSSQYTTG